ncbi:hypothetical protein I4U23_015172 [Adineta vaga]|nr:hypothetical protein I4U23_015172 [Adineta vaga]
MATDINYVYMNKEFIDDRLECSICRSPFVDPVSTDCQPKKHIFCRLCIVNLIKQNQSCPACQQPLLDTTNLIPIDDTFLIEELNELRIKCKICNETNLKRINFNDHIDSLCPKVIIPCPCNDMRCAWTGLRDELNDHLTKCIFSIFRPLFVQLQEQIDAQQKQIKHLKYQIYLHVQNFHKLSTINLLTIYLLLKQLTCISR